MSWFNLSDNINLLAIIGAVAMFLITIFVVNVYFKSMKGEKSSGEMLEDDWDGIKEFKNPLPLGWALVYVVLCIWGVWYMYVGYPLNAYSQVGEYNEEVTAYNESFQKQWSNLDSDTLLEMGEGVFLVQCAPCHGIKGDGISGKAADLTRWGAESGALDLVLHGSKGLKYVTEEMLPMGGGLLDTEDEAKKAVAYMMKHISGVKKSSASDADIADGQEIWENSCFSCHDYDGKGMEGNSPDLTLYGTPEFILTVLERGKKGHIGDMPTFNDERLTDIQKKAVATYILSLSK